LQTGTWFCGEKRPLHLLDGTAGVIMNSASALRLSARMSDDMPQERGSAGQRCGILQLSDPTQGSGPNRLLRPSHAVSAALATE
jgi:hypothetical protein